MPAAVFVVRAIVFDAAKRWAFDQWYRDVHLPDAVRSFGVHKACRFWSLTDPAEHQAMYQFDDAAALERAVGGEDMKRLIADFNRDWPDVTRTRGKLRGRSNHRGLMTQLACLSPVSAININSSTTSSNRRGAYAGFHRIGRAGRDVVCGSRPRPPSRLS
jgi:hypothetical protein